MVGTILGILGKIAGTVAKRIFPDPERELKRLELQQALQAAVLERTSEIKRAAAEVVKTEAQGQRWLQRTWLPRSEKPPAGAAKRNGTMMIQGSGAIRATAAGGLCRLR